MVRIVFARSEPEPEDPNDPYAAMREDQRAYDRRSRANARPQCSCGRFSKPGKPMQMDIMGEYNWSVICSKHGEVWLG